MANLLVEKNGRTRKLKKISKVQYDKLATRPQVVEEEEKFYHDRFREAVQYFARVGKDTSRLRSSLTHIMNDTRKEIEREKIKKPWMSIGNPSKKEVEDYNEGFVQGWINAALSWRNGVGGMDKMSDEQVIDFAVEQAHCSGNLKATK